MSGLEDDVHLLNWGHLKDYNNIGPSQSRREMLSTAKPTHRAGTVAEGAGIRV